MKDLLEELIERAKYANDRVAYIEKHIGAYIENPGQLYENLDEAFFHANTVTTEPTTEPTTDTPTDTPTTNPTPWWAKKQQIAIF